MDTTENQSISPGPSGFVIVPHHVWQTVTPRDLTVYCALVSYADNTTGVCWPSRQTLADLLSVSVNTVDRSLHQLERAGWVRKQRRKTPEGDWTSNLYEIPFIINKPFPVGGGRKNGATQGQKARGGSPKNGALTKEGTKGGASHNSFKTPPEDCAHRPVDEDGYCTACGTTMEETG